MTDNIRLGKLAHHKRIALDLTQEQLAAKLWPGCTQARVSSWERGGGLRMGRWCMVFDALGMRLEAVENK